MARLVLVPPRNLHVHKAAFDFTPGQAALHLDELNLGEPLLLLNKVTPLLD
jgi:hypothetical protein